MAEILVVDDEPQQRGILNTILTEEGHEIYEAGSGEEALDVVRTVTPPIVISDLKMPGMSGVELLDNIMSLNLKKAPTVSSPEGPLRRLRRLGGGGSEASLAFAAPLLAALVAGHIEPSAAALVAGRL